MPLPLLLPVLAGCSPEYGVHRAERIDVFVQNRLAAIDLLLVVDNSCSMVDEQDHLAQSFATMITSLESGLSDWRVAVTTSEPALPEYRGQLAGRTDEIVVVGADGVVLDRVTYDTDSWTIDRGVALERCALDAADRSAFAAIDLGTPGAPNTCAPTTGTPSGVGPRAPLPGDLVVNEFMAWPQGDGCAWLELANPTDDALDLTGVTLRDDGRDRISLEVDALGPGQTLLVADSVAACGAIDVETRGGFHLARGQVFVDPTTDHPEQVFSELVAVGTGGFGLEMGMENALITLWNPANTEGPKAFLREEADLALLFFSDEDDMSPGSIAHYLDAFRAVKGVSGQRIPNRVRVGAAVGVDPAPFGTPSCSSDRGEAKYAERYVALTEAANGSAWSICDDLSAVAQDAGLTFSELLFEFRLSEVPALDTLVVEEYASNDEQDYVGPMELGVDFEIDVRTVDGEDGVWMVFPEDRVPPGAVVTVAYEVMPSSSIGSTP